MMIGMIDMVLVFCPLREECTIAVCHHKHPHEFNKNTCNCTSKIKSGCNPSMTCVHISQMIIPCDDCVRFECVYRGRVESLLKDPRSVENHYHSCSYLTKEGLKRRPMIYEHCPDCFGLLPDLDNNDCQNCLINDHCLTKSLEYYDKGISI